MSWRRRWHQGSIRCAKLAKRCAKNQLTRKCSIGACLPPIPLYFFKIIPPAVVERDECTCDQVTAKSRRDWGEVAAGRTKRLLVRGTAGRWWCENGVDGGRRAAGQVGQVRAAGDKDTKIAAAWAPIFNLASKLRPLFRSRSAISVGGCRESRREGRMPRKGPGVIAFQLGRGGGQQPPLLTATDFFLGCPGLKLSRKSALPLLARATAYNFAPPALPPKFHRICFLLFSPFIFGASALPAPPRHYHRRPAQHSAIPLVLSAEGRAPHINHHQPPQRQPCRALPRTRPSRPPSLSLPRPS